MTVEEQLDAYIDALNEGRPTNGGADDLELQGLFSTVRQLHALREPVWPTADFPKQLAAELSLQLAPQGNGFHARDIDAPVSNAWLRPSTDQPAELEPAPPSRWRQFAQFGGAVAALSIFAIVLIVVFQGVGDGGFLPGAAPDEPEIGQIAFTAVGESADPNIEPQPEVRLVNADGTGLTTLADGAFPTWSPDGERIAFTGFVDGTGALHVMDADGGHQTRLTNSEVDEIMPAWSPDGQYIAFLRDSAIEDRDAYSLWVVRPDGSDERMLVEENTGPFFPIAWSPDGSQIAFSQQTDGNTHRIEIVTVASGETHTVVEALHGMHVSLAWSPDGHTIASMGETADNPGLMRIHLIDVASGEITLLPETPGAQLSPTWSPDGTSLAFMGTFDGMDAIYTVAIDNLATEPRLIHAEQDVGIAGPSWSPDSRQIAFIRNPRTLVHDDATEAGFRLTYEMAVLDLNASKLTVVAEDAPLAALSPPVWRPTPSSTPVEATPIAPEPEQTVIPIETASDETLPEVTPDADQPVSTVATDDSHVNPDSTETPTQAEKRLPPWIPEAPISEENALRLARHVLNDEEAELTIEKAVDEAGLETFHIEQQVHGLRYNDVNRVRIDVETGQVSSARIPGHTTRHVPPAPIDNEDARRLAQSIAQQYVRSWDQLELYEESDVGTAPGDEGADRMYEVTWNARAADGGAWLPTWVSIGIDLETGQLFSFSYVSYEYDGPTVAAIPEAEAIEIAQSEALKVPYLEGAQITRVELSTPWFGVLEDGGHVLAWIIGFTTTQDGEQRYRYFAVDAITGEVLNPADGPRG